MKIRAVFSALLLAMVTSGLPNNANAMHSRRSEKCHPITRAETFYNKSNWFLKIQIKYGEKIIDTEINLREKPVDIRIGWAKDAICLLQQYPDEYKAASEMTIFVPTHILKTAWEKRLAETEMHYLMLKQGTTNPFGLSDPDDYLIPQPPKQIPNN